MQYTIKENNSSDVFTSLKIFLKELENFEANKVVIHYNINDGLGPYNIMPGENLPVHIYGTAKNEGFLTIHLAPLSAGYKGTEPQTLCKILDYLGFNFDKNDIITSNKVSVLGDVDLTYIK